MKERKRLAFMTKHDTCIRAEIYFVCPKCIFGETYYVCYMIIAIIFTLIYLAPKNNMVNS